MAGRAFCPPLTSQVWCHEPSGDPPCSTNQYPSELETPHGRDLHSLAQPQPCLYINTSLPQIYSLVTIIMTCYYPDGQPGDGLVPCNTTAAVSHCCRAGDLCVKNGFCFSTGLSALVRRGCTDRDFNGTAGCPQQCTVGRSLLTHCLEISN
jgi:hypothetical protein